MLRTMTDVPAALTIPPPRLADARVHARIDALGAAIVRGATTAPDLEQVVEAFAVALVDAGLSPRRVNVSVVTVHPSLDGIGYTWRTSNRLVVREDRPWGFLVSAEHLESPLHQVMTTRRPLRLRLDRGEGDAFAVTRRFAGEGGTDYVAFPLPSGRGPTHVVTLWTDRPGGWPDDIVSLLVPLSDPLGLVVELFEARRLTRTVVETYLGPRTGPLVLAGQIHRGESERIRAAVWFSDLRSYTDLTHHYGDEAIVRALDGWFDLAVDAVQSRGGEVLKFMGDALLAIFPVVDERWGDAVDAAIDAADHLIAAEKLRVEQTGMPLRSGVSLHTGEVIYGNVGARGRLDFTVLGSAVNAAARISGLCSTLREPILVSHRAASSSKRPLRSIGHHRLRGFPEPVEIFAPGTLGAALGPAGS